MQRVLRDRPQLAAFTGFHGTTSPLHRAAAAGHLAVCHAIVEPLKQRVALSAAAAAAGGSKRSAAAAKWRRLLATVLNQRSHKSLTPLMLACEHGHAAVAAYLLREGADPLAADFVHSRTCLHYAAVGGHADCLLLLCSDGAMVATQDGARPLRDVIVSDMQVQACRFIDQRAFGGLTALHFAVVTGSLEAVQALLRGGASIMVKSDGEAYIGEDFLVPGSSPLHVAVIINNISIAHMEMMNILGTALDERGRRPWEGTSRTDIRSVRNHFRKLPFHLARERHQPQLMSLVDPRIPIDVALDAARDTEHGIGPKRLSTICSLVLQRTLLQWLDNCQRELAREAAGKPPRPRASMGRRSSSRSKISTIPAAAADATSPPPTAGGPAPAPAGAAQQAAGDAAAAADVDDAAAVSPFAAAAALAAALAGNWSAPPSPHPYAHIPGAASAPVSPGGRLGVAAEPAGPATVGAVPGLDAAAGQAGAQRMASLHGYMGMLSIKRPASTAAIESAAGGAAGARQLARQLSGSVPPHQLLRNSSGAAGMAAAARVRFLTGPTGVAADAGTPTGAGSMTDSPRLPPAASPRDLPGGAASPPDRTIKVVPISHRRTSSQGNLRLGGMALPGMGMGMGAAMGSMVFGMRRRSGEGGGVLPPPPPEPGAAAAAAAVAAALAGEQGAVQALALASDKEKDLGLDSEGEPDSPLSQGEEDGEDVECGVCLDALVEVAFASCQHKLCLACARNLTQQNKKPPHCPFCRRLVVGFQRVSVTGLPLGTSSKSLGSGVQSGQDGAAPPAAAC
ncbi:hypothetical protein CHLNCDRAFT_136194 [Chlorella variabilis]|uniref:RING-type domain-containing protein n=1 Tax=Chlorella variabilis TaxID=554065 RepID=E1ZJZ4_CHLVA|nr:hypothetical protein CHLNCDRAFT_136194 [Chlorella variabilis]EFN53948.1 hypothetical protein CHLNCDRAFT_136194 [Chlorella variabilis]|eukprot:XP_005846050.1 hypothetical protein CHLNCDRAFT_136194 [Chlorella variabilis]